MISKAITITAAAAISVMFVIGSAKAEGPGKLIVNELSGKCLDVPGISNRTPGTPLQLYDCEVSGFEVNGKTSDQFWVFDRKGQIRNTLSGLCIDIAGTEKDSLIQVETCDAANPAQVWIFHENGFIENEATGKCINVAGTPGTATNTPLLLSECEVGNPQTDQRWRA
jgi:hypothetical protein